MRMRIPYDDLPNTSRLIALCQVRQCCVCNSMATCFPPPWKMLCAHLLTLHVTPFTVLQDIYIARAEGELALEEELYWCVFTICCLMLLLLLLLLLTPMLAVLLMLCSTSLNGHATFIVAGP